MRKPFQFTIKKLLLLTLLAAILCKLYVSLNVPEYYWTSNYRCLTLNWYQQKLFHIRWIDSGRYKESSTNGDWREWPEHQNIAIYVGNDKNLYEKDWYYDQPSEGGWVEKDKVFYVRRGWPLFDKWKQTVDWSPVKLNTPWAPLYPQAYYLDRLYYWEYDTKTLKTLKNAKIRP